MNLKMEGKAFGPISAEIDMRFGEPLVAIASCATAMNSGCIWLDEEQAHWLRTWLNECFANKT